MTYGFLGTFRATPGRRDELVQHLLAAAAALGADDACLNYLVATSDDDDVTVFEVWESEVAHDRSLERDDIRAIVDDARPLITGAASRRFDIHGGKGL